MIFCSLCEDCHTSPNNRQKCWDGSHLGEYSHDIIAFDQQKYNPAVKIPQINDLQPSGNSQLHILNDKLVNLRNVVLKPVSKSLLGTFKAYLVLFSIQIYLKSPRDPFSISLLVHFMPLQLSCFIFSLQISVFNSRI